MIQLYKIFLILLLLSGSFSCKKRELSHESISDDLSKNLKITINTEFDGEKYELNLVFYNSSNTEYLHVIEPEFMLSNFDFIVSYNNTNLHRLAKPNKYVTQTAFTGHVLGPHESFVVKERLIFEPAGITKFEKSEQAFQFFDRYEKKVELKITVSVAICASNFISGKCSRYKLDSDTVVLDSPSSWILEPNEAIKSIPIPKSAEEDENNFTLPPAPLPPQ